MKTVVGRPVIWRWVMVLLISAVIVWGVAEMAVDRIPPPEEQGGELHRTMIESDRNP